MILFIYLDIYSRLSALGNKSPLSEMTCRMTVGIQVTLLISFFWSRHFLLHMLNYVWSSLLFITHWISGMKTINHQFICQSTYKYNTFQTSPFSQTVCCIQVSPNLNETRIQFLVNDVELSWLLHAFLFCTLKCFFLTSKRYQLQMT